MKKTIVTGGRAQNRTQMGLATGYGLAAFLAADVIRPTRIEYGGRGSAKTPPKAHYEHHSGNREKTRRLKQLAKQEAKKL